jgi:hypothetical protein
MIGLRKEDFRVPLKAETLNKEWSADQFPLQVNEFCGQQQIKQLQEGKQARAEALH